MYAANQKRAFVTGAASGFGRAFCIALAKRGYKIAVTDINLEGAEETASLVNMAGGIPVTMRVDVTKPEDLESGAERFFSEWGGVDLLINNAGVAVAGAFEEIEVKDWRWIIDLNLLSVVFGCRAFIPGMRQQGGGHILNVASLAGIASLPLMGPYNTTKAAVISISETLKAELKSSNIGVTVSCPSFFKTNLMDSFRGSDTLKGTAHQLLESGKLDADQIARMTLEAVDKNRLYAVPHRLGRILWRLRRSVPETYFERLGAMNLEETDERQVRLLRMIG